MYRLLASDVQLSPPTSYHPNVLAVVLSMSIHSALEDVRTIPSILQVMLLVLQTWLTFAGAGDQGRDGYLGTIVPGGAANVVAFPWQPAHESCLHPEQVGTGRRTSTARGLTPFTLRSP